MDNVGSNNPTPKPNTAIPPEGETAPPIRLEPAPAAGSPSVSRAPLKLGSGAGAAAPSAPPAAPRAPVLRPAPPRPVAAAGDRITTCKAFFTKLHPGALHFLEEQISGWLKDNPGVVLKRTDMVTGDITEKKAEPSLIIMVWY